MNEKSARNDEKKEGTKMKKLKIYLDNCCFNRPYDDQTQLRIMLETEAKLYIQEEIRKGNIDFVWSYVLFLENSRNFSKTKIMSILDFSKYANETILENNDILKEMDIIRQSGIKDMDALHIACSIYAKCDYFVTTDDRVLRYKSKKIKIVTPIEFIKVLEEVENDK